MTSQIIGRQAELDQFIKLATGQTTHSLLNIYGPGGIGKTAVGQTMQTYAQQENWILASADGNREKEENPLTVLDLLERISQSLAAEPTIATHLTPFQEAYQQYLAIEEIKQLGGGLDVMYEITGQPLDMPTLLRILSSLGVADNEALRDIIGNRYQLERYVRSAEKTLTDLFLSNLEACSLTTKRPLAILIDTYEEIESLDDWFCRKFVPNLPAQVKLVIAGRNALPQINFDWREQQQHLQSISLKELSPNEARQFLRNHGLVDEVAAMHIIKITGGYPLLLVLAVSLKEQAGGWQALNGLEDIADQDRIASELLRRILREENVREVQTFLEKGCVARWFNPEIIALVLDISMADSRKIYERLRRHSFVERFKGGLKFHDKVRELMTVRLKHSDTAEYNRLYNKLQAYYAEKAGLTHLPVLTMDTTEHQPTPRRRTFGQQLEVHISSAMDPSGKRPLTQSQIAKELQLKGLGTSPEMLSRWKQDQRQIQISDRPVLVAIIGILHRYNGLQTLSDANLLLYLSGHRVLNAEETDEVFGKQVG